VTVETVLALADRRPPLSALASGSGSGTAKLFGQRARFRRRHAAFFLRHGVRLLRLGLWFQTLTLRIWRVKGVKTTVQRGIRVLAPFRL
jgi:hypothetical protein